MSDEDPELQSIKEKKLVEMMRRTRAQLQSAEKYDGKPIILSDATFSSEISKYPLMVVDFWAAWCGPCRMVAPIVEQLAKEYSGRVAFGKLNVDENPLTSGEFQVHLLSTRQALEHRTANVDQSIPAFNSSSASPDRRNHTDS